MCKVSTLNYIHQDHLTGTSVTSDSSGGSQGSITYYPFGDCWESQPEIENFPTDKLFTGQRLDGTGLYYYGARYYDPTIGRFISADTIVPNPMNPQALNRFSYVINNPLKYIDPTGLDYIIQTDSDYISELDAELWYEYVHGTLGVGSDEITLLLPKGSGSTQREIENSQFEALASTLSLALKDIKIMGVTVNGERINGIVPLEIVSPASLAGRMLSKLFTAITLPEGESGLFSNDLKITSIGKPIPEILAHEFYHVWEAEKWGVARWYFEYLGERWDKLCNYLNLDESHTYTSFEQRAMIYSDERQGYYHTTSTAVEQIKGCTHVVGYWQSEI